jgi:hypothetical protein
LLSKADIEAKLLTPSAARDLEADHSTCASSDATTITPISVTANVSSIAANVAKLRSY